jgi:type II secretory pathway pseudopilin PulG
MAQGVNQGRRGGFSLIELLVVIFVIIVIVSITIPALAAARKAARKSETTSTLSGLSQAVVAFETSEKRAPGYFSARQMGDQDNIDRGFTGMQNLLLDLAGGVVPANTPVSGTVREVGPINDPASMVKVNPDTIGMATSSNKNYFKINRKNFVAQDGTQGDHAGVDEHKYPELVDAFGTPILVWVQDESSRQALRDIEDFAGEHSDDGPARFYWASNAAFLKTGTRVGKRGVDNGAMSMIGEDVSNIPERLRSLTGLLGNPGSAANINDSGVTQQTLVPASARGTFVFHSAGEDGAFLPKMNGGSPTVKDAGIGQCNSGASGAVMDFGLNLLGADNKPLSASTDVLRKFNDIVVGSGS